MLGRSRIADLRAVLEPGEGCSYSELIERLNQRNLSTAAIGTFIKQFAYKRGSGEEFTVWMRERFWDDEVVGGWNEGTLWIARRSESRYESELEDWFN
jgi:hypothetical protein